MWLCWFTPGIATGLFLAAYFQWFSRPFDSEPAWYWSVLGGLIATVLLGCAAFAAFIHAGKLGRERFAGRVLKLALLFILAQLVIAPLIGFALAHLIDGR